MAGLETRVSVGCYWSCPPSRQGPNCLGRRQWGGCTLGGCTLKGRILQLLAHWWWGPKCWGAAPKPPAILHPKKMSVATGRPPTGHPERVWRLAEGSPELPAPPRGWALGRRLGSRLLAQPASTGPAEPQAPLLAALFCSSRDFCFPPVGAGGSTGQGTWAGPLGRWWPPFLGPLTISRCLWPTASSPRQQPPALGLGGGVGWDGEPSLWPQELCFVACGHPAELRGTQSESGGRNEGSRGELEGRRGNAGGLLCPPVHPQQNQKKWPSLEPWGLRFIR